MRPARQPGARLHTVSLRRRVTASSLLVLATVLVLVGMLTDVLVAAQNRSDLQSRLDARAATAVTLVRQGVHGPALVRRLESPGVHPTVTTATGTVYAAGPQGPPTPGFGGPPGPQGAEPWRGRGHEPDRVARATLPDGSTLEITASSDQVSDAQQRLRRVLIALGVAGLVVAGLVTLFSTRLALAPLDTMTGLARSITRGDRGRRLSPTRTDTELGRTAAAFDAMLDELEGAEAVARDSEAAARDSEAAAQDSEARTRRFVADAAHELRTPLAGVRAAAEAALDPGLPTADRDRLQLLLLRDTQRAGRLVDDLLAMARIDAGIELHPVPVDLHELAGGEAERVRLLAPKLNVALTGGPVIVPGDPQRIGQVLANLLDNARRHTPDGGTITIEVTGSGSVTVSDTGPGVPAADRERIFERLVRLDAARSSSDGGAGLGLAIARGIALAHGGQLRCIEPPSGRGAAFRLELPGRSPG